MGRGRKKGKKDPLTPAERSKRYREKQLETNPEGYKKQKKKHNRCQYEEKEQPTYKTATSNGWNNSLLS